MSALPSFLLTGFALEAMILGFVMRRRGYDGYVWLMLGMFLGPVAIAVAIAYVRRRPSEAPVVVHAGAARAGGALDVLVGYDGSPESADAVARVHDLLGAQLGRVAIAHVAPIDALRPDELAAKAQLDEVTRLHPELAATAVMLHGLPANALQDYAREAGYDLIVAGTRGAGWSKLMGSVATALAHASSVPVLLVDNKPAVV